MSKFRFPSLLRARAARWIGVALCAGVALLAPPARAADSHKPFTVDVILPLSGPAAFLGKEEKAALDVAVATLARHGSALHFVYHDTQSSPQTAVQLVSELKSEGARIILGPSLRATCLAVAPLAKDGPLIYCLSPTLHPAPGSFLFTSGVDTHEADRATVTYARLRGWKRIALITTTDATGIDAVRAFKEAMQDPANKDVRFVATETFDPHDISVTAQITHIAVAKPDVIFAWGTGAPIATVFRGLVQAGLTQPVATSFAHLSYAEMHAFAGFLPKRLYIAAAMGAEPPGALHLAPKVAAAAKELWAALGKVGKKPDTGALTAWDPPFILADAVSAVGSGATAAQLRQHIATLKGFAGINGLYDFEKHPQRGVGIENIVLYRWNADKTLWQVVSGPMGVPLPGAAMR